MKTIQTINNPKYRRMLRPQGIAGWIEYLDFMTEFYFKVMVMLGRVGFKDPFRAEMTSSLQMMFTKGKAMRQLVDGYNHRQSVSVLESKADHTILFTLVRAAYEQLCVFELVYAIPETAEKRKVMESIYTATAEVNRLKMFTEEALLRNMEKVEGAKKTIKICETELHNTHLYQSLNDKEKKELDKEVFTKGGYQIVFPKAGGVKTHVGWDEIRNYCNLWTDAFHGVYKYACNMAHPSYLALIQFHEAYKEGAIDNLNSTAVMQMIAIMSVYIMDFLDEYSEARQVYETMDDEAKFVLRMFSESFRNSSV